MHITTTSTIALAALSAGFSKAQIPLYKSYVGKQFTDDFYFYTDPDPANGIVNYVSQSTAQAENLVSWTDSTFKMKADSTQTSVLGKGRDSVRLVSKNDFGDGVYIFDMNHMPVGCGTWPAAWTTTTTNWPYGGEIDVIEGANANSNASISVLHTLGLVTTGSIFAANASVPANMTFSGLNTISLHTAPSCPLKDRTAATMNGIAAGLDCSGLDNGNVGCGVSAPGKSFGGAFNDNGGGIYAMYRNLQNASTIESWFWPRDVTPPADISNTSATAVNPSTWGKPTASFQFQDYNCGGQFLRHVVVLNIDFCGDYAQATYASSGCPGICEAFVKYNPQAFTEAFFEFRSLRIYGTSWATPSIARPIVSSLAVSALLWMTLL